MKKVLFLYGDSLSNVYQEFGKSLAQDFAELNLELVQLRMSSERAFRIQLETILREGVRFAFGFAGAGHALRESPDVEDSVSIWDAFKVPFIGLYGDSPAYAADFHRQLGGYTTSLYGFQEHLDLRLKLGDIRGALGRSRSVPINSKPRNAIDFEKKKTGRVVFLKNGNSAKKLFRFWDGAFNMGTRKHLFALKEIVEADVALANPKSVEQVVDEYLEALSFNGHHLMPLKLLLIAQLDDFLRRLKSELVADTMLDFPTEVRGLGWEHLNTAGRAGRVVAQSDFLASNRVIEESLAIVDMSPNTNSNFHDRFGRAAGLYTLCLTNEQSFMHEHLENVSSLTFKFDRASIAHRIEAVLADPSATVALGISVAEQFRKDFTAKAELSRWLELSDLVRTNQAVDRPPDAPPFWVWPPIFMKF